MPYQLPFARARGEKQAYDALVFILKPQGQIEFAVVIEIARPGESNGDELAAVEDRGMLTVSVAQNQLTFLVEMQVMEFAVEGKLHMGVGHILVDSSFGTHPFQGRYDPGRQPLTANKKDGVRIGGHDGAFL